MCANERREGEPDPLIPANYLLSRAWVNGESLTRSGGRAFINQRTQSKTSKRKGKNAY